MFSVTSRYYLTCGYIYFFKHPSHEGATLSKVLDKLTSLMGPIVYKNSGDGKFTPNFSASGAGFYNLNTKNVN